MEVVKDIDFPKSLLINERNKFFNRVEDTVKKWKWWENRDSVICIVFVSEKKVPQLYSEEIVHMHKNA